MHDSLFILGWFVMKNPSLWSFQHVSDVVRVLLNLCEGIQVQEM